MRGVDEAAVLAALGRCGRSAYLGEIADRVCGDLGVPEADQTLALQARIAEILRGLERQRRVRRKAASAGDLWLAGGPR